MNKSVLMNSDINESSEIDYVADSSFQDHTLFQILDIQYVCAENRLRHLITRISCRFLQLFYNIPKSNLSNFQFICSLLVIPDLSGKSGKLASCNILSGISQFLKKPGSRLIALRVNACRVKRIGAACNTHETSALLECFRSKLRNLQKIFSACETAILLTVNYNVLRNSLGNTGNILKKGSRSSI